MHFVHDLYVNWSDGGSRAHQIPEYHEWKSSDHTELMDQIPIVFVKPELYAILEDGYVDIPKPILESVYKQAYWLNPGTKRRNQVAYAFILTDGKRAIAINTEGETKPNLKSRLIPRQDALVFEIVAHATPLDLTMEPEEYDEVDETIGGHILSLKPEYMVGLTRREKEMKEIVMDCLFNISCSDNFSEIYYWYVELFPKEYDKEIRVETEEMLQRMFDLLKQGWGKQHEEFGTQLVKVYDIFKDDWADLIKVNKTKDKVAAK